MSTPDPVPGKKPIATKRFILAAAGILLATALCAFGKMTGAEWVAAFAAGLAGHRAEDIVKAFRGQP